MSVKIHIARPFVEALTKDFPELDSLKAQLLFGDKVEVVFQQLTSPDIDRLHDLYGPLVRRTNQQAQIATLRGVFADAGPGFTARIFEAVVPAMAISSSRAACAAAVLSPFRWPALALCGRASLYAKTMTRPGGFWSSSRPMPGANWHGAIARDRRPCRWPERRRNFRRKGFFARHPELIAAYDANTGKFSPGAPIMARNFPAAASAISPTPPRPIATLTRRARRA